MRKIRMSKRYKKEEKVEAENFLKKLKESGLKPEFYFNSKCHFPYYIIWYEYV